MEFISKPRNIVSEHRKRWPSLLLIKVSTLGCGANIRTYCLARQSVWYILFERQLTIHLKKKSQDAGTNFSQEIPSLQTYYLHKYHKIQICTRHIHKNILDNIIYNGKQCFRIGNWSIYSTDISESTDSLNQSIFFMK